MKSITNLLTTTTLVFCLNSQAQNLVPNSGFENFTSCPTSSCQWDHATNWSNVNGATGCNNGNAGSPDYFHSCGSQFFNFPNTLNGQLNPYSGNAVMGIATWLGFVANFREYLGVQLTSQINIEIYRIDGVQVFSRAGIQLSDGYISLQPLAQGMYVVKLSSRDKVFYWKKQLR